MQIAGEKRCERTLQYILCRELETTNGYLSHTFQFHDRCACVCISMPFFVSPSHRGTTILLILQNI